MQRLQEGRQSAERAAGVALALTATILLAGLVIAALLAWRISRGVTQPVIETVRLAEASRAETCASSSLPFARTRSAVSGTRCWTCKGS